MRPIKIPALLAATIVASTSKFAAAQPSFTDAEIAALAQTPAVNAAIAACSDDHWRLCGSIVPGGGRIVRCLAERVESLSPTCRSAMIEARNTIAAARGVQTPAWPVK